MKLTNKQIRKIIKEELTKVLNENIDRDEMLKIIEIMLSSSNGIQTAIELGLAKGLFYNYEFYDASSEDAMHKIESYEHTFETTPEFIKLAAEKLGHDLEKKTSGRGSFEPDPGYFEHSFADAGFGCKFAFHLGKHSLSDKEFAKVTVILSRSL